MKMFIIHVKSLCPQKLQYCLMLYKNRSNVEIQYYISHFLDSQFAMNTNFILENFDNNYYI